MRRRGACWRSWRPRHRRGAISQVFRRCAGRSPVVSGRGEGSPEDIPAAETSPETAVLSDGAEGSWRHFPVFCSLIWAIPSIKSKMTDNAILSHIVMRRHAVRKHVNG
jgi:hypothetical protein